MRINIVIYLYFNFYFIYIFELYMDFNEDSPLGQQFNANPYEYLQNYIRNMNN